MTRVKDSLIYTYAGTNKSSRAADIIIALLRRAREKDAVDVAECLIEVETNKEKSFHRLLYYLYYALGPKYGAIYGETQIRKKTLFSFFDALSGLKLPIKIYDSVNYVRHIVNGKGMDTRAEALACLEFASRERIVFIRTLYYNRKFLSDTEIVKRIENYYLKENTYPIISSIIDSSLKITEWVYRYFERSERMILHCIQNRNYGFLGNVYKKAIQNKQEGTLRKYLTLSLNEKIKGSLFSMIRYAGDLLAPPTYERLSTEIQGDNLIFKFYCPTLSFNFSIGDLDCFYESVKTSEDAIWFLDVVEETICSQEVIVNVDDIAKAIDEARNTRETRSLSLMVPLKQFTNSLNEEER